MPVTEMYQIGNPFQRSERVKRSDRNVHREEADRDEDFILVLQLVLRLNLILKVVRSSNFSVASRYVSRQMLVIAPCL